MAGSARQQSSYALQRQQQQQQPESNKPRTPTTSATAASNDPKASKPKLRTSCDGCQEAKLGCSQEKPTCRRCMRHGTTCVYSPFRRIGRPRKSTNPRSTNTTTAKSRSKNDSVDERLFASPIERSPDASIDGQTAGVTPFDTLIAPPSSPASTDNGCGSWYPWSSDGNSLSGMNMDMSANFMEGMDPFPSTTDYLDVESCFDTHHDMLMNYPMPMADETLLGSRPSMQPTPPSSIDDEMSVFGEAMTRSPTQNSVDKSPHYSLYRQRQPNAPSSTSGNTALKLETHSDVANLKTFSPQTIKTEYINPNSQGMKEELSNNPPFTPTPSLSPSSATTNSLNPSFCNKRCPTTLMQQLASLSSTLSSTPFPTLDTILSVERDTSSLLRLLLTCTPCITNKSNQLVFSMVVEQITRLFETLPNCSENSPSSASCNLQVGNFQVDDSNAKAEILKRLVLSRLTSFNCMLKEFEQNIDEEGTDCNTNAAHEMLRDVHRRLDMLREGIEHWD